MRLANTLARQLNERHPGKDYTVMVHAYGYSRPAPLREVPYDQVFIALVHGFLFDPNAVDVDSPVSTKVLDEFNAWMAVTENAIWRPNLGDSAHWQSGGPGDATAAGAACVSDRGSAPKAQTISRRRGGMDFIIIGIGAAAGVEVVPLQLGLCVRLRKPRQDICNSFVKLSMD
ncbi:hypothetical protein AYO49_01720 [Verrucomicrobiaceae bacterium SCGC AG-212-N21]|nr:hypothetical protein AYO49_01720 [Verrucomicrobiaceae bacterium SCGC AG-212-N21]